MAYEDYDWEVMGHGAITGIHAIIPGSPPVGLEVTSCFATLNSKP